MSANFWVSFFSNVVIRYSRYFLPFQYTKKVNRRSDFSKIVSVSNFPVIHSLFVAPSFFFLLHYNIYTQIVNVFFFIRVRSTLSVNKFHYPFAIISLRVSMEIQFILRAVIKEISRELTELLLLFIIFSYEYKRDIRIHIITSKTISFLIQIPTFKLDPLVKITHNHLTDFSAHDKKYTPRRISFCVNIHTKTTPLVPTRCLYLLFALTTINVNLLYCQIGRRLRRFPFEV